MNIKDTVFLPKTSLPMKGKPEGEVAILSRWDSLYQNVRRESIGRPSWVLHDGPPYANGDIHVGHALNKTLKDMLVRGHTALGFDAPYMPGWDCHGLPIEWKVEEQWRRDKKDKSLDPAGFRRDCREFAEKWVTTQKEQFKRLGVLADWDSYFGTYRTMNPEWESGILHTFHDMVRNGQVYRANKPVSWSPVERTALADAETVEREHIVPNIWVRFPVHSGPLFFEGANLLVWTTTPWSLPGHVAVAYNPAISYGLYECPTGMYVVADALVDQALPDENYERVRDVTEADFVDSTGEGHMLFHPLGNGYKPSRIIPASFVRESAGTGFVHVGPAHSTEDWIAWRNAVGDEPFPNPIAENGVYNDDVPVFAGIAVTKGKKLGPANGAIVDHLTANGMLYHRDDRPLTMQHSWRSDAVLITRAAPQVFINLETARDDAIKALDTVKFTPPHGKQRMVGMLEGRPDWLVSRQRLWGTPLALFVHKTTGAICDDPGVLGTTHQTLMDSGSEAWFDLSKEDIFDYNSHMNADEWERLDDVLDVWFDSGCVHRMMNSTADLVVEGSDQSRGWFQSSLLVAVLNGEEAPFREVFTHGFVLDAAGLKMSKSAGNVIDPLKVIDKHGADTLRVWVAATDVTEDLRLSPVTIDTHAETARKVRNTMRYMVGALDGYGLKTDYADANNTPELERYIRHRMLTINGQLAEMIANKNMTQYMATIANFCINDLSSLLFDIRKDALYCDPRESNARLAYRYTLHMLFHHMAIWIAPVMPFAAEELFQARYPLPTLTVDGETSSLDMGTLNSVHLQKWPKTVSGFNDARLAEKWGRIINYRSQMLTSIEQARNAGEIKSATEAHLTVYVQKNSQAEKDLRDVDIAELAITGSANIVVIVDDAGDEVRCLAVKLDTQKCDRCWLSKPDVKAFEDAHLCNRCNDVVFK